METPPFTFQQQIMAEILALNSTLMVVAGALASATVQPNETLEFLRQQAQGAARTQEMDGRTDGIHHDLAEQAINRLFDTIRVESRE